MPSSRAVMDAALTEANFQAQIVELAKAKNWMCYHTHDSRRSEPGFPDLVLVRGPTALFLEVKAEKGHATPQQLIWIAAFDKVRRVHAAVVKPSHWDEIANVLAEAMR